MRMEWEGVVFDRAPVGEMRFEGLRNNPTELSPYTGGNLCGFNATLLEAQRDTATKESMLLFSTV
jgi:hypothetical protein